MAVQKPLVVDSGTTQNLPAGDQLEVNAGTAALPALTIDGDPNTGIYSPAADQLAISTGGTQRVTVDASGNVGIGTASPAATFDVRGSVLAQNVTNSTTAYQFQRVLSLSGTSVGVSTSTTLNAAPSPVLPTNLYAGGTATLTGGTGAGQSRAIVSNDDSTLTITPAWTTTPDATTTYSIVASPSSIVVDTTTGRVGIGMFNTSPPTGTLHVFGGQAAGDVSGEPIVLRAQDGGLNGTDGGAINLTAGNSGNTAGNGGSINLTAGAASGGGDSAGSITLSVSSAFGLSSAGSINADGRLNAPTIDCSAGAITIGAATATSITLGRAGATSVDVTPRLNAATIDRATAGAITVGAATATSVVITPATTITNSNIASFQVRNPVYEILKVDTTNGRVLVNGSGATVTPTATLDVRGGNALINGVSAGKGNGSVATATAFGVSALAANTGANNTAIGYQAGDAIVGGFANTCAGAGSLGALTTGNQNTAVGFSAGGAVVSANGLTAIGYQALNVATVTNTAVGSNAGVALTSGTNNVLMGPSTLGAATTATRNVAIGSAAGGGASGVAAGVAHADSVAIGTNAGIGTTSTGQNTVVGANGGATTITTGANVTLLGYNAAPSAATVSNEVTLGNSSVATLRCAVNTITLISDQRDKADTQDLTLGMEFLSTIRPVQFKWDRREWYATPILDDEGNVIGQTPGVSDGTKKQDKFEAGFIAQELDAAQTAANAEWMGLALKNNPDRMEATPLRLFPVVVKACQELHAKNQQLEARLAALEAAFAAKP